MTLIAHFQLASESGNAACYEERAEEGHPPIVGSLTIQNWALPRPVPSSLRVVVDFYGTARPSGEAAEQTPVAPRGARQTLSAGAKVTIIKSTVTGVHYPPEWLQQYLGRTGTVLWTTADGAMVRLGESATWFHHTELTIAK
jgi:hypothetical protein